MTDTELLDVLLPGKVFEVVGRGGHWQAFYRVPTPHYDTPELPGGCYYRSVRAGSARVAIELAHQMWVTEQTKHRLTK
jgi:hypothetical protein